MLHVKDSLKRKQLKKKKKPIDLIVEMEQTHCEGGNFRVKG